MKCGARADIRIFPDIAAMSRGAAASILSLAHASVASGGRFAFALSGGSTPRQLYSLLAAAPWREAMPWPQVHLFWADERCVPPDHRDSNYGMAHDTFLAQVPLPDGNVHRIRAEAGPDRAAEAYEEELEAFFGPALPSFDLVLLGSGEDGHTASLFPGSMHVRERKRLALAVSLARPGPDRVTLTLPVLNNARQVLFLVAGKKKAGVVHEIVEDGNPKRYPAGLVEPVQGCLTWMLDRQAAQLLTAAWRV